MKLKVFFFKYKISIFQEEVEKNASKRKMTLKNKTYINNYFIVFTCKNLIQFFNLGAEKLQQ